MIGYDEASIFIDEEPRSANATSELPPWRILLVDDDQDVHEATKFALHGLTIFGRPLEFLHTHSSAEAQALLSWEQNIAVVLLDVVMETATAGLDLVDVIRKELKLDSLRIILRTGQPGHAPDVDTVRRYDINDYHTKSELTRSRLYVALSTAIRTYDQIEQVAMLAAQLKRQAFHDALVNLPNRNALIEAIDHRIAQNCKEDCLLALLDVDQFAEINDMFGHAYADRLLLAIARRLEESVGSNALVARIGADTFALFGPTETLFPERLRTILMAPFSLDEIEHVVSFAIGIVRLSETQGQGTDRIKDASIALKRAKCGGQGQLAWFTPEIGHETRERTRLLYALREAFNYEKLFVVYQPQLSLETGEIIGFEALARWRTEEGKFVPPDLFIPVAENSGLIVSIGTWVLRMALRAAAELRQAGLGNFHMAVNVSVVQFRHKDFLTTLDAALRDTNTAPHELELEITESVAMMGSDTVAEVFAAMKNRGIALAIDDFGTGFSSLSYLSQLPVDRIKIDRSFVWALESGKRGARIAEMVIPLGRQLGMKVLAEGVENERQLQILRELGCDEGQGYLFAKPLPLPEVLQWAQSRSEVKP